MSPVLAVLLLTPIVLYVAAKLDPRDQQQLLTFSDWWREVRIAWHDRQAKSQELQWSAIHTAKAWHLRFERKPAMRTFLAEIGK